MENIRRTVAALGAGGMQVLRGVEDGKAFEKGLNNTTTARGLLGCSTRSRTARPSTRRATRAMIEILKRQKFNDAIPAGLPPGTPVAHKTGNITRIHHDAAIVYGPQPVRARAAGARHRGQEAERRADGGAVQSGLRVRHGR